MNEKLNSFTNTTNLNFKVGDVVEVRDKKYSEINYISIVTKVLPNGRFKLECDTDYWRADGTKNTHARKHEKDYQVFLANNKAKTQMYWRLTGQRLSQIGSILEMRKENYKLDDIKLLNKFLDFLGFERKDCFKSDLEAD